MTKISKFFSLLFALIILGFLTLAFPFSKTNALSQCGSGNLKDTRNRNPGNTIYTVKSCLTYVGGKVRVESDVTWITRQPRDRTPCSIAMSLYDKLPGYQVNLGNVSRGNCEFAGNWGLLDTITRTSHYVGPSTTPILGHTYLGEVHVAIYKARNPWNTAEIFTSFSPLIGGGHSSYR